MESLGYKSEYYTVLSDVTLNKGRHWCPRSEAYAGGDVLASHLLDGWRLDHAVLQYDSELSVSRVVTIYEFRMYRAGEYITLPVVCNPYVRRVIRELHLRVIENHKRQRRPAGL